MCDQKYLQLLRNLLDFDLKVLYPWKAGSENEKLSKLFKSFYIAPLGVVLLTTSFVYSEWDALASATVTENLAVAITMLRSFAYSMLALKFYDVYKSHIGGMFDDRKVIPEDPQEQRMTASYCKTEYIILLAWHVCFCIVTLLFHGLAYLSPNAYHLPLSCYIIFLPPDDFLFGWELNYLVITIIAMPIAILFFCFAPLPLLMMNHSCWLIDMALVTAEKMNSDLQLDEDTERVQKTNGSLKKFVERCEKFVAWQAEVQDLLQWNFDLEFQVQSLILCFSIYALASSLSGSLVAVIVAVVCLSQLFGLCWMGSRVTSRIDQLSQEIGDNWYLMKPTQRKLVSMIIHWTQYMRGFSGIFRDVSLETFHLILEASYSFYTFLRSTNV